MCCIAGGSDSRKNAPNAGNFLFRQRYTRSQWLSKISRKSVIHYQLGEENLILGKLSALYETPN